MAIKKIVNLFFIIFIIAFIFGCTIPAAKNSSNGGGNTNVTVVNNSGATYDVTNYGAKGDGVTDDSTVINNVITICNANGGGTVYFPSHTYYTNSIHLKSNVTLYLDGATLLAGNQIDDPEAASPWANTYQDFGHSFFQDALIWGANLNNVKIIGKNGTINGNTNNLRGNTNPAVGGGYGDKAISLKLCTNAEVGGADSSDTLTIMQFGHFAILATATDQLSIHDIFVPNVTNNQRDVMDIMECNNVTVKNINSLYSSDDVVKIGSDFSLGYARPMSNFSATNISAFSGCDVCMIGSETVGPISNVSFSNVTVNSAGKAGIGIMSNDGSDVNGVTVNNVTMQYACSPIWIKITSRNRYPNTPYPNPLCTGRIRNVTISNVTSTNNWNTVNASPAGEYTATAAGFIDASNNITNVENITFTNVYLTAHGAHPVTDATAYPTELVQNSNPNNAQYNLRQMGIRPSYGWYVRYANGVYFHNCTLGFDNNDDRYVVVVDTSSNIELDTFSTWAKGISSPGYVELLNGVNSFYMHGCQNEADVPSQNFSTTKVF